MHIIKFIIVCFIPFTCRTSEEYVKDIFPLPVPMLVTHHLWTDVVGCPQYSMCPLVGRAQIFGDTKVPNLHHSLFCQENVVRF